MRIKKDKDQTLLRIFIVVLISLTYFVFLVSKSGSYSNRNVYNYEICYDKCTNKFFNDFTKSVPFCFKKVGNKRLWNAKCLGEGVRIIHNFCVKSCKLRRVK